MATIPFTKLPKPNSYGSYWLGKPGEAPCILPLRADIDGPASKVKKRDTYMLTLPAVNDECGVVFCGEKIMEFSSPEEALAYLRKRVN